jgi:hypothetical protein
MTAANRAHGHAQLPESISRWKARHASNSRCLSSGGSGTCLGSLADEAAFLLGKGGVDVEHERISVRSELGYDERYALTHQPTDEMHITA